MTRIEVAILLGIATIVAAVTVPAIREAAEQRRLVVCQNNLRQCAMGFYTFADQDASDRLCSGLPDWLYDGCPDEYGWPADLRHLGKSTVLLQCLVNPARVPETFEDLIGTEGEIAISQMSPASEGFVDVGRCADFAVSFTEPNDESDSGKLLGGDQVRIDVVNELINERLFSNYAASWYLVRTGHLTQERSDGAITTRPGLTPRHRAATIGPLRLAEIDRSSIPASFFPILGDAAPSRRSTPQLESAGYVTNNSPAATTMSGVVSYYNERRDVIMPLPPGALIRPADYENPETWKNRPYCKDVGPTPQNPRGDGGMDGKLWLSDLRGWKAVHPVNGGTLSVLMADGSVKLLADTNGDGFINPGFDIREPEPGTDVESPKPSRTGYVDNTTEVFRTTMFTLGEFKNSYAPKGTFE